MPTSARVLAHTRLGKRLISKGISQKSFLTDDLAGDRYKKNLPSLKDDSLYCIRYVLQYCFPKNRIVPSRERRLFPGTCSTLLHRVTSCVILLCAIDVQ
jgi:hypothetical protein